MTPIPAAAVEAAFNAWCDVADVGEYRVTNSREAITAALTAALPHLSAARGVVEAWQQGYHQGVQDERTSEANIGIAGFGAKVEPARINPYLTLASRSRG